MLRVSIDRFCREMPFPQAKSRVYRVTNSNHHFLPSFIGSNLQQKACKRGANYRLRSVILSPRCLIKGVDNPLGSLLQIGYDARTMTAGH